MSITHFDGDATAWETFVKDNKFVVVDFHATWCGPCKRIAPDYEEYSQDEKFKDIKFCKVDVDQATDLTTALKITAMPTFLIYRDAKIVKTIVGADISKVREELEALIAE